MAEWSIAAVLKTVVAQVTVGSNPTPTAICGEVRELADPGCLLSSYGASHHGFESHPLRHFYYAPVAQRIEHLTTDQNVGGSSPLGRVSDLLYIRF